MRFIIVVVIITGFFAINMSKYGETKSNNTPISAKKVPLRLIKMTLNECHKWQELHERGPQGFPYNPKHSCSCITPVYIKFLVGNKKP